MRGPARLSWRLLLSALTVLAHAALPAHGQAPVDVDFENDALHVTKLMSLSSDGGPGCQGLQFTQNTRYIAWRLTTSFLAEETSPDCLAPRGAVTLEIQLRFTVEPEDPVQSGCENATFKPDEELQLLGLERLEVLGTFQVYPGQPVYFFGTACELGSLWVVGNTTCPGMTSLSLSMDIVNASDNEDVCKVQKFQDKLQLRQLILSLVNAMLAIPVMILGCAFCCIACPGGCKCFNRPCCGKCCGMRMTSAEKTQWMKLINAGGHSRMYTINLIIAGVLWLQTELFKPEIEKPIEYTGVDIVPLSGSAVVSIGMQQANATTGYASIAPQFNGISNWALIMLLCISIGFIVYVALMMNYQIRGRDKSVVISIISFVFLIILNAYSLILIYDASTLISFYKYKWPFVYLYSALAMHLLLTDVFSIVIFVGSARRKSSKVKPGATPGDRWGPLRCLQPTWSRFRAWVLEDASFQYSAWMLAAVISAAHVLCYSYLTSLTWLGSVSDCLADTENCVTSTISRYFYVSVGNIIGMVVPDSKELEAGAALAFEGLQNMTGPLLASTDELCSEAVAAGSTAAGLLAVLNLNDTDGLGASLLPEDATRNLQRTVDFIAGPVTTLCSGLNTSDIQQSLDESARTVLPALLGAIDPSLQPIGDSIDTALASASGASAMALATYDAAISRLQELADVLLISAAIGYTVGFFAGAYALVLTLASYKELVNNIRRNEILRLFSGKQYVEGSKYSVDFIRDSSNIQASIFFTGIVTSTAYIQLQVFGIIITAFGVVLGYRPFWEKIAARYWGYAASILIVLILNIIVVRKLIGSRVCDGRNITKSRGWVAYYIISSFAQVAFGALLAITRIAFLLITSLVAINRLDVNLFTIGKNFDNGYNSFMGMVAMVQAMQARERKRWARVRYIIKTARFREYASEELQKSMKESPVQSSRRSRIASWLGSARMTMFRRKPRSQSSTSRTYEGTSRNSFTSTRHENSSSSSQAGDDRDTTTFHSKTSQPAIQASASLPVAHVVNYPLSSWDEASSSDDDGTNRV